MIKLVLEDVYNIFKQALLTLNLSEKQTSFIFFKYDTPKK